MNVLKNVNIDIKQIEINGIILFLKLLSMLFISNNLNSFFKKLLKKITKPKNGYKNNEFIFV